MGYEVRNVSQRQLFSIFHKGQCLIIYIYTDSQIVIDRLDGLGKPQAPRVITIFPGLSGPQAAMMHAVPHATITYA